MNLDHFFTKQYNHENYNCLHFASDIWLHLTKIDVRESITKIMNAHLTKHEFKLFENLIEPITPCIVIMQRPHCTPHVGIYLNGNLLHLTENGVECLDLKIASRGFKTMRFIR